MFFSRDRACPHSTRSLHQDLLSFSARRVLALPLLLGVPPTVFSVISPARAIGRSDLARSRDSQCCSGENKPRIPMVKGQLRGMSTRDTNLALSTSRVPNSDIVRARHLDSTTPPGSHSATSTSGLRGSRNTQLRVSYCWKPRMPNPRCSGFAPPVPPGIDGPDQIGDRTSRFQRAWDPCTPQFRFTDARWPRVPSSRSNDPLDSAGLHDGSVRRFSSSMKRPPLRHLPSVRLVRFLQRTEEAILPELRPPTPSENFHEPCTPFQLKHSPSVEVLLGPVHSRLKRLNPLLLRLSTETQLRPALTGTARITRPNSGRSENKGSTA
jgi:hypothetical protein